MLIQINRPEHQQMLIDELKARGMSPVLYHSGGGNMHVAVMLVPEKPNNTDLLMIATGCANYDTEIGLMGWHDGMYAEALFTQVKTLESAVQRFVDLMNDKEHLLVLYNAGAYDL